MSRPKPHGSPTMDMCYIYIHQHQRLSTQLSFHIYFLPSFLVSHPSTTKNLINQSLQLHTIYPLSFISLLFSMEGVQVHTMYQMGLYHHQQQHHMNNVISDNEELTSSSSSSFGNSNNVSNESSSSSDLLDDASSSSSSSNGPLFQLSGLMDQLPIKRGLSKYYQGKSQSFTSLARVASLEDLAKKESPYQRRLKACRSYGGGLNTNNNNNNNSFKSFTQPKPTISKKVNKGSLSNLSCMSRNNSFMMSLPPLSPVQKTF